jgi:hypothetical protein
MPEIVTCPACDKKLQVPEDFFGKTVQCPECKHMFTAGPAPSADAPQPQPAPVWEKPPPRSRERDDDDDDRPRKRRSEDDDDAPRRRYLAAHRGGMILAFGILALLPTGGLGIIFGPLAWIMGNADLKEMRAGRMDPSGESQTNTGRILGMIATILQIVAVLAGCLVAGVFIMLAIAGGAAGHR